MIKKIIATLVLLFMFFSAFIPIQKEKSNEYTKEKVSIESNEIINVTSYIKQDVQTQKEQVKTKEKKTPKYICKWQDRIFEKGEYEILCRTVYCEAGNQKLDTQIMVALTILNRVASKKFPNSIKDVVYQKNAYAVTTWENFEQYDWTEQVEKAVNIALKNNKHPRDMFYFRTKYYHKFGKSYIKSDDLWFSTED